MNMAARYLSANRHALQGREFPRSESAQLSGAERLPLPVEQMEAEDVFFWLFLTITIGLSIYQYYCIKKSDNSLIARLYIDICSCAIFMGAAISLFSALHFLGELFVLGFSAFCIWIAKMQENYDGSFLSMEKFALETVRSEYRNLMGLTKNTKTNKSRIYTFRRYSISKFKSAKTPDERMLFIFSPKLSISLISAHGCRPMFFVETHHPQNMKGDIFRKYFKPLYLFHEMEALLADIAKAISDEMKEGNVSWDIGLNNQINDLEFSSPDSIVRQEKGMIFILCSVYLWHKIRFGNKFISFWISAMANATRIILYLFFKGEKVAEKTRRGESPDRTINFP